MFLLLMDQTFPVIIYFPDFKQILQLSFLGYFRIKSFLIDLKILKVNKRKIIVNFVY